MDALIVGDVDADVIGNRTRMAFGWTRSTTALRSAGCTRFSPSAPWRPLVFAAPAASSLMPVEVGKAALPTATGICGPDSSPHRHSTPGSR
jgi:hypothetical protein